MNVKVVVSAGVALLAGVGTYFVAQSLTGTEAPVQIIEPTKEETVRVLVSTRDIQRGERITDDDGDWVTWPKKALQDAFITDDNSSARDALAGSVARTLIVTGEPIVEQKVVHAGDSGLMAAILTPGMRAVTIRVSPETSSGGFILPGDQVDILQTIGREDSTATKTLFQDVRVLSLIHISEPTRPY